jgi:hypothetical protein
MFAELNTFAKSLKKKKKKTNQCIVSKEEITIKRRRDTETLGRYYPQRQSAWHRKMTAGSENPLQEQQ